MFRLVEAECAGPSALGILVPPGRRTFVILRPRGLAVDLVLCRGEGDPRPRDLAHDEASAVAHALYRGLREGARVLANDHLWATIAGLVLVACERRPGQPYAPLQTPTPELEAALRAVMCPEGEQETYFNVRHFSRG